MTTIHFEIHCKEENKAAFLFETSGDSAQENQRGAILAFLLFTLRQFSNLKGNPTMQYLSMALNELSEQGSEYFPEDAINNLLEFSRTEKKNFVGDISFDPDRDHMNFQMKANGFGLFATGVDTYTMWSVLLMALFFLKKFTDADFEKKFMKAVELCSGAMITEQVSLTNQNSVAASILSELGLL